MSKMHPDPGEPEPYWKKTHSPAKAKYRLPGLSYLVEAPTRKGPRQAGMRAEID